MDQTSRLHSKAEKLSGQENLFERRISDLQRKRPSARDLISNTKLLWRMVAAWRRGDYQPSRGSIVTAILALGYFLNPIDLIPDFIPIIGWIDDIGVYLIAMALLAKELKRFEEWESSSGEMPFRDL